ncbi:hypothetical protein AgCh_038925 [Apium graveolens]
MGERFQEKDGIITEIQGGEGVVTVKQHFLGDQGVKQTAVFVDVMDGSGKFESSEIVVMDSKRKRIDYEEIANNQEMVNTIEYSNVNVSKNGPEAGDFNDMMYRDEKMGGRDHPRDLLLEVQVIEVATSDHLPLFLSLNKKVYEAKGHRFRFENIWLREKECMNVVRNGWDLARGMDVTGKIQEEKEDIQRVIEDYFSELFTTSNLQGSLSDREVVKQVSDLENEELLGEITCEEVKEAVFSMHPYKASGIDGFNPAFYQAFWSVVEIDVVKFCRDFMQTGLLPEGVNKALVCLIPKVVENMSPGKYLGMPMSIGRKKNEVFNFLVDRIEQKLQTWRMQNISKAGKVNLLKGAAQTVPNIWMQLILITLEICDSIEKKINSYWWGGGIKWISWSRVCEVKEAGGLGFKRLREFNMAMLAKQAWRLMNNSNSLVTALMKAKYYANGEFVNA